MCPYRELCPFYRANKNSTDLFVRQCVEEYCLAGKEGCVQRDTKTLYDTFLAMNQMPDATLNEF